MMMFFLFFVLDDDSSLGMICASIVVQFGYIQM